MRIPVKLDGTAFHGHGKAGSLEFDLPGFIWSIPRSAPISRPDDNRTVLLRSLGNGETFARELSLEQGDESITMKLRISQGDFTLEGGHVMEVGKGIWSVSWPITEEDRGRITEGNPDLVVWVNARHAYRSADTFLKAFIDVRRASGPSATVWAPRLGVPSNLAMLHYIGIDLVDSIEGLFLAGKGKWIFPDIDIDGSVEPGESPCKCPSCAKDGYTIDQTVLPGGRTDTLERRAIHALSQYHDEELRARLFLSRGRLRELVEMRAVSQPFLAELLRRFDMVAFEYAEAHLRTTSDDIVPYGVAESYRRPEMEAYRRRFLRTYTPPSSKKVLVLVPCSYTKPYSNSPTHRGFSRALSSAVSNDVIHMVSVTSPLGVVPKELECFYPARNYDIPVTGTWSHGEREWVRSGVKRLLDTGSYERTLVHLSQREYGWMKDILPPSECCTWTSGLDSPSSKSALLTLEQAAGALPVWPLTHDEARLSEALSSLAFQFSPEMADLLIPGGAKLRGPPWFVRLTAPGGEVLATWKEDRGCWHLTVDGAERVKGVAGDFSVEVNREVKLSGDLFAPGAISAGKRVRVGSEALLVTGGALVGVGESVVPGEWIGRLRKGLVVKVRKHGRTL